MLGRLGEGEKGTEKVGEIERWREEKGGKEKVSENGREREREREEARHFALFHGIQTSLRGMTI